MRGFSHVESNEHLHKPTEATLQRTELATVLALSFSCLHQKRNLLNTHSGNGSQILLTETLVPFVLYMGRQKEENGINRTVSNQE